MVALILGLTTFLPISHAESNDKINLVNQFVEEQRERSKIPGISVVIVENGKTVYQEGFGYADVREQIPVTAHTLFELASTSKAFTGLAILQLEKEGLLKRTDDVRNYIPWLDLEYKGEPQTMTINQLLYHTSGIASNTIVHIPESNAENALELTVKTLLNQPLNRKPGSSFEYATINYDVLGLVIEEVSKQPYDLYMKEHLLEQLEMKDTYVGLHQVHSDQMATGYKIGFMRAQEYTPPIYRGNVPAGYIVSNTNDIAKWLNLQLGAIQDYTFSNQTIKQSHIPDLTVGPMTQGIYYASGWSVQERNSEGYIWHDGANPTYSSYFIMQPDKQIGVAVLSNMNTIYTTAIGNGLIDIWVGNSVKTNTTDAYQMVDKVVTILCIIIGFLGIFLTILLARILWGFKRKLRAYKLLNGKRIFLLMLHSLFVGVILTLVMVGPKILNMSWDFIRVWGPTSISMFYYTLIVTIIAYYILVLWLMITKKVSYQRGL